MTTDDSGTPAAAAEDSLTNFTEIQAELDAIAAATNVAEDAFEAAQQKIGIKNCPRWGLVRVQTDRGPHDWSQSEVEHAAAEGECYGANTTPEECKRALAELERLERDGRAEEDRLGLTPLRAAVDTARDRWRAVMDVAASTPAQTVADLAIKLELTFEWDGTEFEERLKAGALQDAKRLSDTSADAKLFALEAEMKAAHEGLHPRTRR